jgi:Ca-activated chloride channel family protein
MIIFQKHSSIFGKPVVAAVCSLAFYLFALPATAGGQTDEVIRIAAENVVVPVSVLDRSGKYISTLKQSDFRILEDGVDQEITSFETTDSSVTVYMLLERNGMIRFQLPRLIAAANSFVRQMRPEDRFAAITFGGTVETVIKETKIKDVPKGVRVEKQAGDESTYLHDSIEKVIEQIGKVSGRKAIVVFSEGYNAAKFSAASSKGNIKDAEESGATVYTVKFNTRELAAKGRTWETSRQFIDDVAKSKKFMTDLAVRTGGRAFDIEKIEDLDATFAEVASELVRQYTLGYSPLKPAKDGDRRKIAVKVNVPEAVVRSRKEVIYKKAKN